MAGSLMQGLPIIETERLILRNFKVGDKNEYFNYHTAADVTQYYDWKPDTMADAENDIKLIISDYEKLDRIQWAITAKDSDTLIGDCGIMAEGLKGEINYMLSRGYWGTGIMTEALGAVISFCFNETSLQRIQALSHPENQTSEKLLKRLAFSKEGLLRKYGYNMWSKQAIDLIMWSLLKEEHQSIVNYKVVCFQKY